MELPLLLLLLLSTAANTEKVLMTEVFAIVVDPLLFNWTFQGTNEQFVYQPSLLNAPDLPNWMQYVYSERHHSGFLFGVPPNEHNKEIKVEIIALNRQDYETRRVILPIEITEKLNPAKYEVQLKIDNLNVQDMFDVERMERLKDIFRKKLWVDSQNDLYVTFLASALDLGARLPLKPQEGEGVVLRIGSTAPLSNELNELQDEVRPLWRVPSCPRDFKRTTVERLFRENGFALDWCTFRLLEDQNEQEELVKTVIQDMSIDKWVSVARTDVPVRSYVYELVCTIVIPMVIMLIIVVLLSMVLCVQHDELSDPCSETFFANLFHICVDYFDRDQEVLQNMEVPSTATRTATVPSQTLRSVANANQNEINCLSPESVLLGRSHTNSPNSTIARGLHCRPSPPPYVRPKIKPNF